MISEFTKEKVFWTTKMNLKLVKFIETRPNIWNPNHPKYTSNEYRDQTYATFASKYGNEFTGQAVKDRWTNIRSTFAYYQRKVYKVTWPLWEPCSFLLNVNKKKKLRSSAVEDPEDDIKDNTDTRSEELNSNEDNISNKTPNEVDSTCENIANGILNVFRGIQNNVFNVDNTEFGDLGCMLVNKLSEMSSFQAAQVSNKIMNILWLYHEDNPFNPNNVKSEDS